MLLLSSLPAFLGCYLFIRSVGSGFRYGIGTCGPEGCSYSLPLIFAIDEILFVLLLPLTIFTLFSALLLALGGIWQAERRAFDGACMILTGSLLFLFLIIGGYPALKILGPLFLAATLLLLVMNRHYRTVLSAVAIMYAYPILFW